MDFTPINFRSVSLGSSSNIPTKIFRSAALNFDCDECFQWLTQTVGIKSYIDLRVEDEYCPSSVINKYFIKREPDEMSPDQLKRDSEQSDKRYRYQIPIYMPRLQNFGKDEFLKYSHGLLEDCGSLFKILFSIMLNAKSFPILITCRGGKDRTGVVVALIKELVGDSDESIIDDYTRSEESFSIFKEELTKLSLLNNVTYNDDVCHSFPETIKKFLEYLKQRFGGAENYLRMCGLTEDEIEQIKRNLTS